MNSTIQKSIPITSAMVLLLFLSSASAVPINGASSGLSGSYQTIKFSENPFTPVFDPAHPEFSVYPPPIGTDYSGLGVTFSSDIGYATASMYGPAGPNFNEDAAVNFANGHWLITFNTVLKAVAFAYGSDPSIADIVKYGFDPAKTKFTALLNGAKVEDFTADTIFGPEVTNNIYGFQNILFNQVQIDVDWIDVVGNGIDNLQFAAVPEPSTFVLLAIGILMVTVVTRRNAPFRSEK